MPNTKCILHYVSKIDIVRDKDGVPSFIFYGDGCGSKQKWSTCVDPKALNEYKIFIEEQVDAIKKYNKAILAKEKEEKEKRDFL